jgi:hypothetical protein
VTNICDDVLLVRVCCEQNRCVHGIMKGCNVSG